MWAFVNVCFVIEPSLSGLTVGLSHLASPPALKNNLLVCVFTTMYFILSNYDLYLKGYPV